MYFVSSMHINCALKSYVDFFFFFSKRDDNNHLSDGTRAQRFSLEQDPGFKSPSGPAAFSVGGQHILSVSA